MQKWISISLLSSALLTVGFADESVDQKDNMHSVSYALGFRMGQTFKEHHISIDQKAFLEGFSVGFVGSKAAMTDAEMTTTLDNFQKKMIQDQQQTQLQAADTNAKAAKAFLEQNKTKPGVVTLPDGMQYRVLMQGSGLKPKSTDTVTVDYEGSLLDGKVFDSSYQRGTPAQFPLNGIIPGWQEILQKMSVGSTWMVYIPPELAYGASGSPGGIPPNALLTFKIHLISIDAAPKN